METSKQQQNQFDKLLNGNLNADENGLLDKISSRNSLNIQKNIISMPQHRVVPKIASEFRNIVLAKKFGNSPEDADR
jgi:hypothetical protein